MIPNYDLTLPLFSEGDVVTGRVVRVDKDEVLVNIGYKSEGVIPLPELSIRKSVKPEEEVSLGEWVNALVMQKEDQDGRLILSKKRARFEKAWKRIEAAAAAGEHVEGTVIEVVKGGLILDLGVRGFLPASLVNIRRVQDLDEFLGRKLECKVIELNRNRNNVVLSRRAVLEDERREVRQKILDDLQPGQVVEGVISNIVEFGAFVDLDGIDGLIHISELSWSHVNHPSEVLTIGEKVNVKVLDIDRDRQRISLGLKQTQADPWQSVIESYQVGDVVEGRVTKVVTFGAFVEIHSGVEGLVHISELAAHHVENPREVVNQGDVLAVRVIEIDADRRRLSLSLKRVADGDEIQHHLPEEIRNAVIIDQEAEAAQLAAAPPADEFASDDEAPPLADEAGEAVVEDVEGEVEESASQAETAEAAPEAEAEVEPVAEAVAEVEVQPEPEVETEPEAAVEAEPEVEPEPEVEASPSPRLTRRRPSRAGTTSPRPDPRGGRREAPPVIALTGGIGSGKSEALAGFAACGAATLSSDDAVHAAYARPEVVAQVRRPLRRRRARRGRRRQPRAARPPRVRGGGRPGGARGDHPPDRRPCARGVGWRAARRASGPAAARLRGADPLRGEPRGPVRGRARRHRVRRRAARAGRGARAGLRGPRRAPAPRGREGRPRRRRLRQRRRPGGAARLGCRPVRRVRWDALSWPARRSLSTHPAPGSRRARRPRPPARPTPPPHGLGARRGPVSCPRSASRGTRSTRRCRPGTPGSGTRWSTRTPSARSRRATGSTPRWWRP